MLLLSLLLLWVLPAALVCALGWELGVFKLLKLALARLSTLLLRLRGHFKRQLQQRYHESQAQQRYHENEAALCFKLPQLLLARVLHEPGTHQQLRLVCRRFREAFDSGVTHLRTRPMHTAWISSSPWSWAPLPLVHVPRMALQAARPQSLALHCHRLGAAGVRQLAALLRSRGCDLSGLQELHLHMSPGHLDLMFGAAAAGLETLLPALLLPPGTTGARSRQRCLPFGSGVPLRVLDLSRSLISPQGARQLAAVLLAATHLSSLQSLDLSGCRGMGTQGLAHLAAALRGASHLIGLREVSLHGLGGFKDSRPWAFSELRRGRAPWMFSAEQLAAGWQAAIGVLAAALLGGPFHQLRSLDLSEVHLGDAGLAHIAATLLSNAARPMRLQRLVLRGNDITSSGLHALVGLLQSWSRPPNALPAPAGTVPVPVPGPSQPVRMRELDLSDNFRGVKDAGVCDIIGLAGIPGGALSELRALALAGTGMGPAGAHALASTLGRPHCLPQLRVLELSCNPLGDEGVQRIVAALQSAGRRAAAPLRELGLAHCKMGDYGFRHTGASEVAALLRGEAGAGLQRLDLARNHVSAQGMHDVVAALHSRCSGAAAFNSHKLHHLGLCCGVMDSDTAAALASVLHVSGLSPGLQALDVDFDCNSPADFFQPLMGAVCGAVQPLGLPGLRELRLSRLPREAVVHLASALEGATHLTTLRVLEVIVREVIVTGDEAVLHLAASLAGARHLSGLQRLSLSVYSNDITATGALGVAKLLCGAVHLAGLQELELKVNEVDYISGW